MISSQTTRWYPEFPKMCWLLRPGWRYIKLMAIRTSPELRVLAEHLRGMASEGTDASLRDALLLVAEEFEKEAGADPEAQSNLLD